MKDNPENYRGITLLSSVSKLFTKFISFKIEPLLQISEEQQGFRKNRSTTDAIYIIRQVAEKAIEYAKPAYLCFIDLTKAFDRVKLHNILEILQEKKVNNDIRTVILDLNTNTKTKIRVEGELTDEILTGTGIRQGDSLSPLIFNAVMDKIINKVKKLPGYKLGEHHIDIICYADDAVLIAESEDDLQRMLYRFLMEAKKYNMEISTEKTKSMTVTKEPVRCKLEVEGEMIEQVMTFKYLGINITSSKDLTTEVREQVTKGTRISGYLRDITWRNKYLTTDSKVKVYKTMIRPIMTYGAESRADTTRTKQIMRTAEMNILRSIIGKTRMDRIPNQEVRQQCNITDIIKFIKTRRKEWNNHISRAGEERLIKICRDNKPSTRRPPGRPPKRWVESWATTSEDTS